MSLKPSPQPAKTTHHYQFEVEAKGLGRYSIDVSLPPGIQSEKYRYPLVLVVDGNLLFDQVQVSLHGRFVSYGGMIPPSVVVGVGYPADEGFASFYARRNHDYHG